MEGGEMPEEEIMQVPDEVVEKLKKERGAIPKGFRARG